MPAPAWNRSSVRAMVIALVLFGTTAVAVALQIDAASKKKAKPGSGEKVEAGQASDAGKSAPPRMQLEVTINKPANSGRGYRKPYVAAWLTDKDDFPVRTILLWVQKDGKGPRWIPDLRQWYRDDRMRQLVDDQELVDAVSGPTRNSGTYKVAWDGNDDLGQTLPAGTYTLNIEAAREHGTYQIIREKLELTEKEFEKVLKGNEEIKSVRVKYAGTSAVEK